jgi:hypothetical protein
MSKYIKVVLFLDAGLSGTDEHEFLEVNETDWLRYIGKLNDGKPDVLGDTAWLTAKQHAESYGIYPEEERSDGEDDESCEYSYNIEGYLELYDPEKHDGYRTGNSESWERWF